MNLETEHVDIQTCWTQWVRVLRRYVVMPLLASLAQIVVGNRKAWCFGVNIAAWVQCLIEHGPGRRQLVDQNWSRSNRPCLHLVLERVFACRRSIRWKACGTSSNHSKAYENCSSKFIKIPEGGKGEEGYSVDRVADWPAPQWFASKAVQKWWCLHFYSLQCCTQTTWGLYRRFMVYLTCTGVVWWPEFQQRFRCFSLFLNGLRFERFWTAGWR